MGVCVVSVDCQRQDVERYFIGNRYLLQTLVYCQRRLLKDRSKPVLWYLTQCVLLPVTAGHRGATSNTCTPYLRTLGRYRILERGCLDIYICNVPLADIFNKEDKKHARECAASLYLTFTRSFQNPGSPTDVL